MSALPGSRVDVSVVVIGRNEGERLTRCLASVQSANWGVLTHEVVYVDSNSTDDSLARAGAARARALLLQDPAPCAAKARNLGWRQAGGSMILFLDGDTELHPEFVLRAHAALVGDSGLCAAWGHRREAQPHRSLYMRVLDLDWLYPPGRTPYFGGDVLVRRVALEQVGGFDPTLNAGEEPELCARLRAQGWQIEHLDVPMTRHDLGIYSFSAYCRRAYRSGIAYAEVAHRMRERNDPLWQRESRRDFRHGLLFLMAPLVLAPVIALVPALAVPLGLLVLALLARSALRCAWKAPREPGLRWLYALHSQLQKVPAFWGQVAWLRARKRRASLGLVEYRGSPQEPLPLRLRIKDWGAGALQAVLRIQRACGWETARRLWALARLRQDTGRAVHPSNVVLGAVDIQGTGRIRLGRRALIYPNVCLETQGQGEIHLGDDVVLSRGVHIVAFSRVELGDGVMLGEYTSLRDADHRLDAQSMRSSGHVAKPIVLERNVWVGRGVTVLKGVRLEASCVVGANAVVTRNVPAQTVVGGIPARPLGGVPSSNRSTHLQGAHHVQA